MSAEDERRGWTFMSTVSGDDCRMATSSDRSKALQVFAANLQRLMEAKPELNTAPKLAAKIGGKKVNQKTISRILKGEAHETKLRTVELIAKAFDLQAWQMLLPGLQPGERPEFKREAIIEMAEAEA